MQPRVLIKHLSVTLKQFLNKFSFKSHNSCKKRKSAHCKQNVRKNNFEYKEGAEK